jgi:hypothetical protein
MREPSVGGVVQRKSRVEVFSFLRWHSFSLGIVCTINGFGGMYTPPTM